VVFVPVDDERLAFPFDGPPRQDDEAEPGNGCGIFTGDAGDGPVQVCLGHWAFLSRMSGQEPKRASPRRERLVETFDDWGGETAGHGLGRDSGKLARLCWNADNGTAAQW